jgi:hypothetical protein
MPRRVRSLLKHQLHLHLTISTFLLPVALEERAEGRHLLWILQEELLLPVAILEHLLLEEVVVSGVWVEHLVESLSHRSRCRRRMLPSRRSRIS